MGLIIERIPHKSVAYAFLEVQADSANEFEALRAEALKRAPHYGFAANAPTAPVVAAEVAAEAPEAPAEAPAAAAPEVGAREPEQASAATAQSTEGLSPREKAKLKMAAKKGA